MLKIERNQRPAKSTPSIKLPRGGSPLAYFGFASTAAVHSHKKARHQEQMAKITPSLEFPVQQCKVGTAD